MKNLCSKNNYLIALMFLSVLSIFVSYFYIGYQHDLGTKDAYEYFSAARFLEGSPISGMHLDRVLTTPAFLYTSIGVNFLVHDFSTSFALINIAFYLLCIAVFYFLALEIYKNERVAFFGSLLVLTNYYVIDPGNAHLADMGGWFFFLLATFLAVRYFNTSDKKWYYFSIVASAVGVFFKEYGGLGLINLILLISVMDIPWKQKAKDISVAVLGLIPLACFHLFIYLKYDYWYFKRYVTVGQSAVAETPKTFILLVKIVGWLFSFGWLAFLYGVWEEWKEKDMRRIKILVALLPVTLTFYVWPSITQRLGVMLMMWAALIAGFGLSRMKPWVLYLFVAVYVWFNYNIPSLISMINLPF